MSNRKQFALKAPLAFALAFGLCLTGCVSNQTRGDQTTSQQLSGDDCNSAAAALIGGLIGALITDGSNRVRGAAVGAGLASLACVAWNHHSEQTKSASQVQQEYASSNQGRRPSRTTITRYDTSVGAGGRVSPGGRLEGMSDIEIVQGASGSVLVVEEEVTLTRPDGKDAKPSRKLISQNTSGGAYRSTYSIEMPRGVMQGVYPLSTALFVNGEKVAERNLSIQVIARAGGEPVAMMQ